MIKILLKILSIVLVLYVLFYALILVSCSETDQFVDEAEFEEKILTVPGAKDHLPVLESLGDYKTVTFNTKTTKYVLWNTRALSMVVEYDDNCFEAEVEIVDRTYSFVDEKKEGLLDYSASVKGYEIRVVEKVEDMTDDYLYYYPKCFMMIGINKETNSIVYLFHYDIDLDEIKDLDKFIKRHYLIA